MTPSQREAYERECLAQLENNARRLERAVRNPTASGYLHHRIRDVRLDGTYPETAICVRWFDTRYEREKERAYHLWINPVTREPPGSFEYGPGTKLVGREPPDQVAMLIQVWVEES